MATANLIEFTDDNFSAEVLKTDLPVLVDFSAKWCGPCRQLLPTIEALADEFAGKAKIGKVDTDSARQVCVQYEITTIPTLMVFKGGNVVKKLMGFQKKDTIANALIEAASK